jgi:hypothetical protein
MLIIRSSEVPVEIAKLIQGISIISTAVLSRAMENNATKRISDIIKNIGINIEIIAALDFFTLIINDKDKNIISDNVKVFTGKVLLKTTANIHIIKAVTSINSLILQLCFVFCVICDIVNI